MSTLVRLIFYENLLIGQETSFIENVSGFLREKENCPFNKVSVLSRCPKSGA